MNSLANGRPIRVVIRHLGITATSSIEARRLADTIGPALERAFARLGNEAPATPAGIRGPQSQGDRVANRIANEVAARLKDAP